MCARQKRQFIDINDILFIQHLLFRLDNDLLLFEITKFITMDYEAIQTVRRNILAGLYAAPHPFDVGPPLKRQRRKRRTEAPPAQDMWNEEAFQDHFYDSDGDDVEEDVVPDYFHDCDQLVTTYADNAVVEHELLAMKPLFHGSMYSAKDLARFLLSFKARHLKVGDNILANIVAILATFLPIDNVFKGCLPTQTSTYFLLKSLDNLASYKTSLRTLKIHCCVKKCTGYYGDNKDANFCEECDECRWKLCSPDCYEDGEDGNVTKLCRHEQNPRAVLYYNVVQDRLVKLLKSDLSKLFDYHEHRGGMSTCRYQYMSVNVHKCP